MQSARPSRSSEAPATASVAVAEDLRPGPPDYVGVGAAHSGTSWWHALIGQHPRVFRQAGTPGGLHFFDDRWQAGLGATDVDRYHASFARPPGRISGEWTPEYMLHPWTPGLLRQAAPEARLLVLLRDPVERFHRERSADDDRSTSRATPRAAANAAFNRGLYADQLVRLWRAFPREQVLVLQVERCAADIPAQLARTFEFLGLTSEVPADLDTDRRLHASPGPVPTLSTWQLEELARRYAPENDRLAALLPDLDMTLWRRPR